LGDRQGTPGRGRKVGQPYLFTRGGSEVKSQKPQHSQALFGRASVGDSLDQDLRKKVARMLDNFPEQKLVGVKRGRQGYGTRMKKPKNP
jgi:hypothetical protein